MTQEIVQVGNHAVQTQEMQPGDVVRQVALIQEVMQKVMKINTHYGVIPGCGDKPTLLQPGAQKLCLTFRLAPEFKITVTDLGNDHREYDVSCTMRHISTGAVWGEGVGVCSTKESKYKYRTGGGESTEIQIPKTYWDLWKTDPKAAMKILVDAANAGGIEGNKFGKKKNESGQWVITTFGEKVEHDNPADYWNTCKKIACKRALVSGTIQATSASDIFTQDLEDMRDNGLIQTVNVTPQTAPTTTQTQQQHPEPQAKAQEQSSETQEKTYPPSSGKKITTGQVGLIQARCAATGHKDEALKMIKDFYNVESTKDLLMDNMNAILEMIGKGQND